MKGTYLLILVTLLMGSLPSFAISLKCECFTPQGYYFGQVFGSGETIPEAYKEAQKNCRLERPVQGANISTALGSCKILGLKKREMEKRTPETLIGDEQRFKPTILRQALNKIITQ